VSKDKPFKKVLISSLIKRLTTKSYKKQIVRLNSERR